jgi:chorismate synthase
LAYRTAGESHGAAVIALVEGMPAGVKIDVDVINCELRRRQGGYGRGGRQRIERDQAEFQSGLRSGVTLGSPIVIRIANKDHRIDDAPALTKPRPGHADLAGSFKWLTDDCRGTLERASARETAGRVAAGALSRQLLSEFDVSVGGYVVRIGEVTSEVEQSANLNELCTARDENDVYCPDSSAIDGMIRVIRKAKQEGDTLGGVVEVRVEGCPPGLGSCVRWQDKLDGRLMRAVGSIQAFKAVEIGMGMEVAERPGSQVHDEIEYDSSATETPSLGIRRRSNNAGGLEGGMTNGQPVIVRGAMKPISTLLKGLDSIELTTGESTRSQYERSDVCAVPAASVVAENVVAFEIACAFREKFGGDSLMEMRQNYESYLVAARKIRK